MVSLYVMTQSEIFSCLVRPYSLKKDIAGVLFSSLACPSHLAPTWVFFIIKGYVRSLTGHMINM